MVGMQIIRQLDGEDITGVAVGASHACAWSSGGECYFPPPLTPVPAGGAALAVPR